MAYQRSVRKNINLKVVVMSVLLATTFWFLRAMDNDYTTTLSFPIEVSSDSNYVAVGEQPKNIKVNISGYGWTILKLSVGIGAPKLKYDVATASNPTVVSGIELYPFIADRIKDLKVNFVKTELVQLNFDHNTSKFVSLAFQEEIDATPFLNVPQFAKDSILVKGPKVYVDQTPQSISLPLNVGQLKSNTEVSIALNEYFHPDLRLSDSIIEVNYRLKSFKAKEHKVKLTLQNVPSWWRMKLKDKEVALKYLYESSSTVKQDDFRVIADFDNKQGDTLWFKSQYKGKTEIKDIELSPSYYLLKWIR